jgi:Tectonin domain
MRARLFVVVLSVLALLPSGAIGQEQRDDGNLFRLDGQRWVPVDGYGVRVSVAPNGEPWVVNSRNEIWRSQSGGSFEKLPGAARDIGIGADGTVWIIGTDNGIYRWNQNNWDRVEGSGVAISVDRSGSPWVVNAQNQIYRYVNGRFEVMNNGRARDIAAAPDGAVYIVGTNSEVYRLAGNDWQSMGGSAERIAAGPNGTVWVVNNAREVYRWENGGFERMPGSATDIAVNANGQAWIVGREGGGGRFGRGRGRNNN